jgi:glycosyltransferase involved in cell wall biosynthesis
VVAARSGGIPDIVTDGVNGYLFEPDDPQGAIIATKSLLAATQTREELRRNARYEAEQWGWPAATQQLQSYYRSVLQAEYGVSAA